ncbi:hypothetical protein M514_19162 [Trichuris suis]|uniref:Uncharacterized protein n=1 Tax=Trichuris suis TaxID=68888 RepID=A0A085NGX3_9BILA|nr:hypothetical protein M514_19162 [Trichuris suis]
MLAYLPLLQESVCSKGKEKFNGSSIRMETHLDKLKAESSLFKKLRTDTVFTRQPHCTTSLNHSRHPYNEARKGKVQCWRNLALTFNEGVTLRTKKKSNCLTIRTD